MITTTTLTVPTIRTSLLWCDFHRVEPIILKDKDGNPMTGFAIYHSSDAFRE